MVGDVDEDERHFGSDDVCCHDIDEKQEDEMRPGA